MADALQTAKNVRAVAQTVAAMHVQVLLDDKTILPEEKEAHLLAKYELYNVAAKTYVTNVSNFLEGLVDEDDYNHAVLFVSTVLLAEDNVADFRDPAVEAVVGVPDLSKLLDQFGVEAPSAVVADILVNYTAAVGVDKVVGHQEVNVGDNKVGGDPTNLVTGTAGYQEVDFLLKKVGADSTGLLNDATVYTATIAVDGGGAQPISVVGSAAQTFTTLLAEINADLTGATATLENGELRVTSDTLGAGSTIAIVDTNLFSSMTHFLAIQTAVPGAAVTYTATVTVGGVDRPISILGSAAQTFTTLLTELNTDLNAAVAVATLNGGNIRITAVVAGESVVITPGTLFAAPLNGFVEVSEPVLGKSNYSLLSANGTSLVFNSNIESSPLTNADLSV